MNWIDNRYNRLHCFKFKFENYDSDLSIFYNKENTYTAFKLDQTTYEKTKRRGYSTAIFFDLSKSLFSKTFLDTRNFKTQSIDVRNQYYNVLAQHRNIIQCEFSEKIILGSTKVTWDKTPQFNSLTINLFRLSLYEDSFAYILCERQIIDPIMGRKIVRTSSYQIENDSARKYVTTAAKKFNGSQIIQKQNCEDAMRSLFVEDKKQTDKKYERCGVVL